MTDKKVLEPHGEPRIPWEYVPNLELKCLEFIKVEPMYRINCEQALAIGFLNITGTQSYDTEHNVLNLPTTRKIKYKAVF